MASIDDSPTWAWLVAPISAGLFAIMGHIYSRLGNIETLARTEARRVESISKAESTRVELASKIGVKEIWDELDKLRVSSSEFRERVLRDMATKEDLRDMERRLTDVVHGHHRQQ